MINLYALESLSLSALSVTNSELLAIASLCYTNAHAKIGECSHPLQWVYLIELIAFWVVSKNKSCLLLTCWGLRGLGSFLKSKVNSVTHDDLADGIYK